MINRVIPDDVSNCVWVDAGLVSYKLCDFGFDCENCPFDHVMRQRPEPVSTSVLIPGSKIHDAGNVHDTILSARRDESRNEISSGKRAFENLIKEFLKPAALTPLPDDRLYSGNHVWIKEVDKNRYRIGMDQYAVAFLSPPLLESFGEDSGGFVLPQETSVAMRDTPLAWVILGDETIAVDSPINLKVLKSNSQLRSLPILACEDPYNSGWICEVEVAKRETVKKIFLDSMTAETLYHEQVANMERMLSDPDRVPVGVTMMDGGTEHKSLKNIIGAHDYIALLKEFLSVKK